MTLRSYQQQAVNDALAYINSKNDKKVIIIQPVGSGKSHVIAAIANEIEEPLIVLQPSKELLKQNIQKYWDYGNEASVYSASLSSKELGHVTFGTIGSIKNEVNRIKQLGVKVLIIDECHQASKNESQLAQFIQATGIKKIIGLTATPCELGSFMGQSYLKMINRSRKNLFQEVIHCTQVKEVVDGGYWTNIIYEDKHVDTSKLKLNTTGSDYTEESLNQFYIQNGLKGRILQEVEKLQAEGRKSILVFVPSIHQAEEVAKFIPNAACVHSKTDNKLRDNIIKAFKNLQLGVVVNVGVLLTGFDCPTLDAIIHARPTNSFVIHYQSYGRIVRPHVDKLNGKICDYSGNFAKFGKLEDIEFRRNEGYWAMYSGQNKLTIGKMSKDEDEWGRPIVKKDIPFDGIIYFGKYKGTHISELPDGYLKWIKSDFKPSNLRDRQMLKQAETILAAK